jgi:hypothetical protein
VWQIRDIYLGSQILIFTHPGSKNCNKREGCKKKFSHTFLCSHKFHKIENYFSFEVLKKKIWTNFQRIIELFTQKLSLSYQKYGFGIRDPGSRKNLFRIPDPGVKKAPDPGSDPDLQHCKTYLLFKRIVLQQYNFTMPEDTGTPIEKKKQVTASNSEIPILTVRIRKIYFLSRKVVPQKERLTKERSAEAWCML